MSLVNKFKLAFLLAGDAIALYFALFATLLLRYGGDFYNQFANTHFAPFTIIFLPWLAVFYIAGLYDLRRLRNNLDLLKTLWLAIAINAGVAVLFFYLAKSAFGITPRANLFLFVVIFAVVEVYWRRWFNRMAFSGERPNKVLLVANGGASQIKAVAESHPDWFEQLGYEIVAEVSENEILEDPRSLKKFGKKINLIVIPRHFKSNRKLAKLLYELLNAGMEILDVPDFYETISRKIPLGELEESWFIENLTMRQKFYDPLKRAWEFFFALMMGIALLPLEIIIAVIVELSSPGPVIYKQVRVGQHGKKFSLYKFRTMRMDAEKNGAQWSGPGDERVTSFGKFLRYTHLDELPQLLNVIKGELSFVGPRPERPEFVDVLKEEVPYYEVRLLVKPGVTGWAQVHHRADISTDDVVEKLQYDIYYIKNRSVVLDLAIVLKTAKSLFSNPK